MKGLVPPTSEVISPALVELPPSKPRADGPTGSFKHLDPGAASEHLKLVRASQSGAVMLPPSQYVADEPPPSKGAHKGGTRARAPPPHTR